MDITSPLPVLLALLVALATVKLLARWTPPLPSGRFDTIDGLRGYLAFFVFLHHGCIWYFHLRTGAWNTPPSNLFTNMGQGSVALFFMITGFLFFGKLLQSSGGTIDWTRLYCSRVLRLTPLYLFAMLLLFVIVGVETQWTLKEPALMVAKQAFQWLTFTATGAPDINGLTNTFIIVAGVTWSLPYEWAFYLSLPLFAVALRIRVPAGYLATSVLAIAAVVVVAVIKQPGAHHLLAFLGGGVAVYAVRSEAIGRLAQHWVGSAVAAAALACAYFGFASAHEAFGLLLLVIAFNLIACGTDVFGILRARLSRVFGEYAYSIYLLHGTLLYILFEFIIGAQRGAQLSATEHWAVLIAVTPIVLIITATTFKWIEAPAMKKTSYVLGLLRSNQKAFVTVT